MTKETEERLDAVFNDSFKYSGIKTEINARFNAYVGLLPEWEKELKEWIKNDEIESWIRIKEKHIIQLNAKIELLTELKKAL